MAKSFGTFKGKPSNKAVSLNVPLMQVAHPVKLASKIAARTKGKALDKIKKLKNISWI
jgi:hypothetical protein